MTRRDFTAFVIYVECSNCDIPGFCAEIDGATDALDRKPARICRQCATNIINAIKQQGEPPVTEHIMQFFTYEHLPAALQEVSKPFCELAQRIVATLPRNPERTVALRKLLSAKDAAVRAAIAVDPPK